MAPVDLLLQRAGRVHRHSENDAARPKQLSKPSLWVCQPDERSDFTPNFDWADEYIYEGHILLRTWHALHARAGDSWTEIAIPGDVEHLIEEVYVEPAPVPVDTNAAFGARWIQSANAAKVKATNAKQRAQLCSILPPWAEEIFTAFNQQLDEANPEAHATIQAQTRDGDPRLPVVLLNAATASTFQRTQQPTLEEARGLLNRSINLSHKGLVKRLLQEQVPSGWERTPWLHHHRVILLDGASQATFADRSRTYTITLDPVLGVTVTSRGAASQRKEA